MIDCQRVLSELWDWLADPERHPEHRPIREHLEQCASCRDAAEEVRALRSSLKGLADQPDEDFEAGLRARLSSLSAGAADPLGGRFAPDPFLEGGEGEASFHQEALVVDRRLRAFWLRPLGLVATGAVAALVLGMLARWNATPDPALPAPGASPVASLPAARNAAPDSLAARPLGQDPVGVVAERAWQAEDSSQARVGRPERQERLTPVTAAP
jgi:hypothetical protein